MRCKNNAKICACNQSGTWGLSRLKLQQSAAVRIWNAVEAEAHDDKEAVTESPEGAELAMSGYVRDIDETFSSEPDEVAHFLFSWAVFFPCRRHTCWANSAPDDINFIIFEIMVRKLNRAPPWLNIPRVLQDTNSLNMVS